MFQGIAYALGACFIWGLIFVVPQFMSGFSSIEIALGRYFFYGVISVTIFAKAALQGACRYPLPIWIRAIGYSIMTSFGYYTWVVLALRFCSPAICALVLGISPITIAFYGNWKKKEVSYASLILPSVLILIGLVMINAPRFCAHEAQSEYLLGLACSVFALSSWSWFVVANSKFLNDNPQVASSDWSTLLGVGTLFWVAVCSIILAVFFSDQLDMHKYLTPTPERTNFLMGCAVLGLLCSWLGAYLWNLSSHYLPVALAGQLTIFETIFGLIFVYTLEQRLPPPLEAAGIVFLLAAIVYGIRACAKVSPQEHAV